MPTRRPRRGRGSCQLPPSSRICSSFAQSPLITEGGPAHTSTSLLPPRRPVADHPASPLLRAFRIRAGGPRTVLRNPMNSKYTKTRLQNQLISHGLCVSIALTRSRYFPTRPEYIRFPNRSQQLSESGPPSDAAARSRTPAVGSAAPALVASRACAQLVNCARERPAGSQPWPDRRSRLGTFCERQVRTIPPHQPRKESRFLFLTCRAPKHPCRLPGGCLGTQRLSSVVPPHVGARYSTQAYPIFAKSVRPLCVRSMSWSPRWRSE